MPVKPIAPLVLTVSFLLAGCAGIGVMHTFNPDKKLADAHYFYWKGDRISLAMRLVREAMKIYREREDFYGLAKAHIQYAEFLESSPITKNEYSYRKFGFVSTDKTLTYDNRKSKAIEYYIMGMNFYRRAEPDLKENKHYDKLTRLYYNMALISYRVEKTNEYCDLLDKAYRTYKTYHMYILDNPEARQVVPFWYSPPPGFSSIEPEYSSFKEFVQDKELAKACGISK